MNRNRRIENIQIYGVEKNINFVSNYHLLLYFILNSTYLNALSIK